MRLRQINILWKVVWWLIKTQVFPKFTVTLKPRSNIVFESNFYAYRIYLQKGTKETDFNFNSIEYLYYNNRPNLNNLSN